MDWRRTKTIFIFAFLIVNIFLSYQLLQKRSENQYEYLSESFLEVEDQLKNMDITYPDLPEVPKKLVYIIGRTHIFSEDDLAEIESPPATIETAEDDKKLLGIFDEGTPLPADEDELVAFLQQYTLFGDEYIYSNGSDNELSFIQTYNDRPIYQKVDSSNGQISVKLNKEGEMIGYVQTYLDMNPEGNEQDVLTAIKAIHQLYNNDKLMHGDDVTFIELGYYSLVEGDVQVLAPTWLVEVNDERHYLINAINGLIDDPNAKTGESDA